MIAINYCLVRLEERLFRDGLRRMMGGVVAHGRRGFEKIVPSDEPTNTSHLRFASQSQHPTPQPFHPVSRDADQIERLSRSNERICRCDAVMTTWTFDSTSPS